MWLLQKRNSGGYESRKWGPYFLVRLVRKFNQSFVYSLKQEKHEAASLPQGQGWVRRAAGPKALRVGQLSVLCHDLQRCGVCLIKLHAYTYCKPELEQIDSVLNYAVVMMSVTDKMWEEGCKCLQDIAFPFQCMFWQSCLGSNPSFLLSALINLYLVSWRNDVEISPDIPDRQNGTHDSKTCGSNRHPYMANTDHIPRNSYMENTTCS